VETNRVDPQDHKFPAGEGKGGSGQHLDLNSIMLSVNRLEARRG
jgi:hypothetical protein